MQVVEQVLENTPLPVIANVSRIVTRVVDRITGDRGDYPLLVAASCVEALKQHRIEARVMYGAVAWIEILEDQSPVWAGCWGEHFHFWVATQFGEVVDLNTSVAFRKRSHATPHIRALYSPPILWSKDVPGFYRYSPEGVAELELTEDVDKTRYQRVLSEVQEKCRPELLLDDPDLDFPNEAILCPDRRVLDDSLQTFRHFERALAVHGVPVAPF